MVEALFSVNLQGEVMSATFFNVDHILLKDDIVDESLISRVLKYAKNPKRYRWSFCHEMYRIDILKKHGAKVEFFVSLDKAIELYGRNLMMYSHRVTFH